MNAKTLESCFMDCIDFIINTKDKYPDLTNEQIAKMILQAVAPLEANDEWTDFLMGQAYVACRDHIELVNKYANG